MTFISRLNGLFLGLLLALLSASVMAAGADDLSNAERQRLRSSKEPTDILRLAQLYYPNQSAAWHEFWTTATVAGLKDVVPGEMKRAGNAKTAVTNTQGYLAGMRLMMGADAREGLAAHTLKKMIDDGILKADSPFVTKMRPIVAEIERKGQARNTELDERIAAQAEQIRQYQRLTEMLKSLQPAR